MADVLPVSKKEAYRLQAIDAEQRQIAGFALKPNELLLVRTMADLYREALDAGERRSVSSRAVSWRARKSKGWASTTAGRRLVGLGFVTVSGNGYLYLSAAGWALVLASSTIAMTTPASGDRWR